MFRVWADYLPKAELDKFLQRAHAVAHGEPLASIAASPAPDPTALTGDNVGYRLLEKGGWAAGQALGPATTAGAAAVEPLSARLADSSSGGGGGAAAGAGLGAVALHEPAVGDDAFDQYRKRMMLAYRFRPNPLNNPRRDYY